MLSARIGALGLRGLGRASQVCGTKSVSRVTKYTLSSNVAKGGAMGARQLSTVKDPTPAPEGEEEKKKGLFERIWGFDSNVASESFTNRWLMVIPAFLTHVSIGAPYAWSLMADVVSREHGVVASAAADWNLMQAALPVSLVFAAFGAAAFGLGPYQAKFGARKSMVLASATFGGGLLMGAAGIHFHSLPLLYLGYGILGGIGIGWGYTPPVQTLLQWFPDKKGLASGMIIAGFGSGALLFTPCAQYLMKMYHKIPEYLGPANEIVTKTIDSKLFAEVDGVLREVVNAGAAELAKLSHAGLQEGLYLVDTGATGATEAVAIMGCVYTASILASSLFLKKPHPNVAAKLVAAATSTTPSATSAPVAAVPDATPEAASRTPQFFQLGTMFFCVATGGLGIFSVAKPMMSEVFSAALPGIVTSAFASKYLLSMSGGNLGGRLGWATISDVVGRRNMFNMFTIGSIPLYASIPTIVDNVVHTGSAIPMYGFCACTVAAVSVMGGVYAILPAYEADLWGTKHVGNIHGRMMLFSGAASLAGPNLLFKLRSASEKNAIGEMLKEVTPEKFEAAFGAPISQAYDLLAAKTLSISKLMAHMPPGYLDPTPHIYDTTMYTLSGLMAVAFISHSMVKPTVVPIKAAEVIVQAKDSTTVTTSTTFAPAAAAAGVAKEEKAGDRQVK